MIDHQGEASAVLCLKGAPPKCSGLRVTDVFFFFLFSSNKSFLLCGLYAAFVFAGQHVMRERPKLSLRRPLILWSLGLAVFR